MELFRIKKDIPFMRHALIFNVISALTFVAAVFFLLHKGLHFSVEFTGGTVMEVTYPKAADVDGIRRTVESLGYVDAPVQTFGKAQDVVIRLPLAKGVTAADQAEKVMKALQAKDPEVKQQRVEQVGAQVGDELAHDGLMALLFVVLGVVAYLAIRFEWKFAVAAILANLHDVVIILGFFAFFQWEFNLSVLAAVLAVLGYSVNESVIIFDRIRENFRTQRKMSVTEGDQSCDHQHHLAYHHHSWMYANDGVIDVVDWRPDLALFRCGADDRYLFRYLFFCLRCCCHRDVVGCQT
jgi:preprotein translocase subunit SecF